MNTETFEFEGKNYTKMYDSGKARYRFFVDEREMNVYEWNQVANSYHPMCHKAAHPNRVIRWIERHRWFLTRRHIAVNGSKFILDIGCESGNITSALVSRERRALLLDVDREMLRPIQDAKRPFVDCFAADVYAVPFKDGSIDRVICTEVLEHLTDPQKAAHEIARVLKPGGRIVVSVPNDRLILWAKRTLMRMGLKRLLGNLSTGLAMGHLHLFDKKTLASLFGKDFKVICCFYNFPWFTNIFLVAEKE